MLKTLPITVGATGFFSRPLPRKGLQAVEGEVLAPCLPGQRENDSGPEGLYSPRLGSKRERGRGHTVQVACAVASPEHPRRVLGLCSGSLERGLWQMQVLVLNSAEALVGPRAPPSMASMAPAVEPLPMQPPWYPKGSNRTEYPDVPRTVSFFRKESGFLPTALEVLSLYFHVLYYQECPISCT